MKKNHLTAITAALLAVHNHLRGFQGLGYSFRRSAGGQDIVEYGDPYHSVFHLAGSDVGLAEVEVVGSVFLHNLDVLQVISRVGELAFLAERNDVGHAGL